MTAQTDQRISDPAARVLADPQAYADEKRLHEALAHCREHAPVSWVEVGDYRPFWAITKHADIMEIERQNDLFTNDPRPLLAIAEALDPGDDVLEPPNPAGVFFLQAVYLIFALAMPLVQCIFLFALWIIPMRLRDQKIVFDFTEMVASWAALDVFIISIIASCVEIDQFAQFLVGDRCDPIEKLVKEKCFGINTEFLPGCWIDVAAATLLLFTGQIVSRICERVIYDRELEVLDATMRTHESNDRDENRASDSGRTAPTGFIGKILFW
jgi:hypothetical protein